MQSTATELPYQSAKIVATKPIYYYCKHYFTLHLKSKCKIVNDSKNLLHRLLYWSRIHQHKDKRWDPCKMVNTQHIFIELILHPHHLYFILHFVNENHKIYLCCSYLFTFNNTFRLRQDIPKFFDTGALCIGQERFCALYASNLV